MTRFWWGLTTANLASMLWHIWLMVGFPHLAGRQWCMYLKLRLYFKKFSGRMSFVPRMLFYKISLPGRAQLSSSRKTSAELFQRDIFYRTASWFFLLKLDTFHGCWGGGGGGEWIEGRGQGGFLFTCGWFETPDSSRYITHRGIDGNSQSSLIFCLI